MHTYDLCTRAKLDGVEPGMRNHMHRLRVEGGRKTWQLTVWAVIPPSKVNDLFLVPHTRTYCTFNIQIFECRFNKNDNFISLLLFCMLLI